MTIRGDTCRVSIGEKTIIQDNTTIINPDLGNETIEIGSNVNIGVRCYIEPCKIENNCVIGHNATVHKGSIIKEGAVLGPGTVLAPNTIVPSNTVFNI